MSSLDRDGSGGDGTEHPELRQTIVQPRGGRGEGGSGSGGSGSGAIGIGKGAENATAQCSPRDPEKREVDMTMETTTTGNKHASQPQPPRITNHHTPTRTPAFTEKEDGDEEGQQQHRHSHSRRSRCASSDTFYARPVVDVEQAERGGEEISHRHKSSYVWRVLCYLTFIAPFLSVLCALYTLTTLLLLILNYPLQNLRSSACLPFSTTVTSRLLPPLKLHLRFLYSPRHPFPTTDDFSAARLVRVHILSPLVAIPIGVVAAFTSFVWLYTEVLLGDKNDEKGMEYRSFLWVRQSWENFVLSSLKPKELPEGFVQGGMGMRY